MQRCIFSMQLQDLHKQTSAFKDTNRFPGWFIGHGSPMNVLMDNNFTRSLQSMGNSLPDKPNAILVISAHWLTRKGTFVAVTEKPETIYDFYGFPQAMYDVQYPAPGSPEYAQEVKKAITSTEVQDDKDWGLDHGAWTILKHAFPKADIPVFQMSIDYSKPAAYHFALANELQVLRNKGVLIIGSGNIVHNLRAADFHNISANPYPWAQEFDDISKKRIISREFSDLVNYEKLGQAALMSVPTPDHYYPMIYSLGLVNDQDEIRFTYEEIQNASVSMRCFEMK
ncbi:MAG TPA: 4,5-DOPA dioxygenase extradiol [Cyclobacteriaceae bacterium]|nr:4,5-DOPA dioxygenase extradiol [Cyclobacteriaceae bacterium]HNA13013.1 4,5-DOPA dioxygenase extradiol [Cyclobacteriaceae bacterium]HNC29246.1 4,5-DOPA dioxygenase extradiol [Cyclobacteriaceae bacterium]HNF78744.1 4,5-DOPA dioxygenase extradiol [Cyclobacteriaceae bacterium]HNI14880.1 4,5-DOPA dioxygenase extradiol [Cyclobacteriaceae bacterium]